MSNEIERTAQWFQEAISSPNEVTAAVQLGVHIEEFAEMFEALGEEYVEEAEALHTLGNSLKRKDRPLNVSAINRQDMLDALVDQIVTATGVAHMLGFDLPGALAEINRSNYSKFVDGKAIFDANGKIAKGPGYFKADLTKFV